MRVYCRSSALLTLTDEKCLNMEPGIIVPSTDHTPVSRASFVRIILPVYNEERVLEKSVQTLHSFLSASASFPYAFAITIVDNGSTDATPQIGARLAATIASVSYISIPEKGKAVAIRRGWQESGDILAFMDVDLSSDLTYFPALIDAIVRGHDLAVGCRLGKQSQIKNRRFTRAIMSRIYNALVRMLFSDGIQDHQCGFKAIRAEAYRPLAPELVSTGWFFDTELIVHARAKGLSIASIDIKWVDDRQSKVSLVKTSTELIAALLTLYARIGGKTNSRQLLKQIALFLMSGGTAALVNIIAYSIVIHAFGLWYIYAVFVAAAASFCTSFVMQKWLTFREPTLSRALSQFGMHLLLACINVVCNAALVFGLVEYVRLPQILAQILALGMLGLVNFIIYRNVIFSVQRPSGS